MGIDLQKNAANFTEEDKWCLTNMISAMFSLEERGRLGIKLFLDHNQICTKYKIVKNHEIVTFEHMFHVLMNKAHEIESLFLTIPTEEIQKRMNGKYMERVEERLIASKGNKETFVELGQDFTNTLHRPYE